MNGNLHDDMHGQLARFIPTAVRKVISSYENFLTSAPDDFKKHHEACKAALVHLATLLRVGSQVSVPGSAQGPAPVSHGDMEELIRAAREEVEKHCENRDPEENY